MTIKLTIIGTGQIGTSIGLALEAHKELFLRVGHDINLQVANRAKALGALDKVDFNLPGSIEEAAIVILAIPLEQIRETLQYIASELKEDAVIMDTAPLKGEVIRWMEEFLPPQRHYIGLTPVINPAYLEISGNGVEAAHADLFKGGLMAIYLPPALPAEAIKLATDFSTMLGAEHIFIEPAELDSMMAATHILPQLMSAVLLNATLDQPGWQDARKLAGRPFALASGAIAQSAESASLAYQAIASRDNLLRMMDAVLESLDDLRQELASEDANRLKVELEVARLGHELWLKEKKAAYWGAKETAPAVQLPTTGQVLSRMFTIGGRHKPKPPK